MAKHLIYIIHRSPKYRSLGSKEMYFSISLMELSSDDAIYLTDVTDKVIFMTTTYDYYCFILY